MKQTLAKLLKDNKTMALSLLSAVVGTFTMAVGVRVFLVPHDIAAGGFTGIATVLATLPFIKLDIGTIVLLLNIPLFIIGIRVLGSKFGIISLVCTISYSFFLYLVPKLGIFESFINLKDKTLCLIYGAVLNGAGLGLVLKLGGSSGGADMLGYILASKFEAISLTWMVFLINGATYVLAAIVFKSVEAPLYAFVAGFLSTKIIEYIIEGGKVNKAYYIFTEKTAEISAEVVAKLKRGATIISGEGAFSRKERKMLVCIVYRAQAAELKTIVRNLDPNAFLYSTNTAETFGMGFAPLKSLAAKKEKPNKSED